MCAVSASTLLVVLLGCEHQEGTAPVPYSPGVTNMQPDVDSAVVVQLATAACDREQRCFESGPQGRNFASRDDCMAHMRQKMANDLSAYDCANGVARAGLDHCASIISNEECNHPLVAPSQHEGCHASDFCIK
jgi:hypothetical protein